MVLKINPPDPFTGSSSSDSLQDWWLLAKQYLRVCGWTGQPQPVQQAIVNSMLGRELQTTWLRLLDDNEADERTCYEPSLGGSLVYIHIDHKSRYVSSVISPL